MTVSPILALSGQDEVLELPIAEEGDRGTTLTLPAYLSTCSTHITTDLIASSKRPKPPPDTQLLCTSATYIAYSPHTPKTNTPKIIKIIDKENSQDSCKIKGIAGRIIKMCFKKVPSKEGDEGDEVLAVVSCDGPLRLSLYSIVLTDRGLKHEPIGESWELCPNVPEGIVPVLAIQPSDTCIVAVAVGTIIYYVKLDDKNEVQTLEGPLEVPLEKHLHSSPIISMHIADDTDDLIAVCSKSGILLFYNTSEGKLADDPVDLFEGEEDVEVNWTIFPDNRFEEAKNGMWNSIVYASNNSLRIFSLETWVTSYTLRLNLPEDGQDLTRELLYDVDDSGRFVVMTSTTSRYLYVFELLTTEGYNAPDAVSRVYCYPLAKSGLFGLSITEVIEDETVLGPYQETSQKHTIVMIGINDSTMQRYKIVTDTELVTSSDTPRAAPLTPTRTQPGPLTPTRTQPAPLTPTRTQPAPLTPTRTQPAPLTPTRTQPAPLTPTRTQPAPLTPTRTQPSRTTPTLLPPGAFTAIPIPLSDLFSTLPSRSTDQPKDVPVPVEQSLESLDHQLMPTPLPTPAGREEIINPLTDYLQRIPIEGSGSVEMFEAELLCKFQSGPTSEVIEYCCSAASLWQDLNPSTIYLYTCKHLLIRETSPDVVLEVYQNVPDLMKEALVCFMIQLVEVLLSAPLSGKNMEAFPVLRDIMTLFYLHSLPSAEEARASLLLPLVRNVVRSIYETEEEEEGFRDTWINFVTHNIGVLVDLVKEQDYENLPFQHQVRDVLDPATQHLPARVLSNFPVEETLHSSTLSLKELMKRSQEMAVTEDLPTSGNLSTVQLLEQFDNNPEIEISHVTSQLDRIQRAGDTDVRDLFQTILSNYYRKEWFAGLLESVLDSAEVCGEVLQGMLVDKVTRWRTENKAKLRTEGGSAHPTAVSEGAHVYTAGSSPLQFYIRPARDAPLLHLISSTLSTLLPDPPNLNLGSLSRDVATAVAANQQRGFTPREGDLVACFQGYRTWSRGSVTAVHDTDDIRVTLLDSGDMVTTNSECLRRLPLFRTTPAKAKLVRLRGIDCPSEDKDDTMRAFKDTVKGQELYVLPVRDNHVSVFLGGGENLKSTLERSGVVLVTGEVEACPPALVPPPPPQPGPHVTRMWGPGASRASQLACVVQTLLCCDKDLARACPEVKDIINFKVEAVLANLSQDNTESGDSSPSSTSVAPISSPDYPPSDPAPVFRDIPPRTPEPHDPKPHEGLKTRNHDYPEDKPPGSRASSRSSGSKANEVVPTFAAIDVREQEGYNYKLEVTNDPAALSNLSKKLSVLSKTVSALDQRSNENNRKLRELTHRVDPARQLDKDVNSCVNDMFKIGLQHFLGKIKEFYRDEMEQKLQHHLLAITKKQDDLKLYASEDKLREKVREKARLVAQDVKQKARQNLHVAQSQVTQRLREDLGRDVVEKLLPSWAQSLDHILHSFTAVLHSETSKYSNTARQGVQTERDLMNKLELIEQVLLQQHRAMLEGQKHLSDNLSTLQDEVESLYQRHDVRS